MTKTYRAGGSRGATRPDGHKPTGNAAQDAWNRRHEALAQELMADLSTNPACARQEASLRLRAAGDYPPLEIRRPTGSADPVASSTWQPEKPLFVDNSTQNRPTPENKGI